MGDDLERNDLPGFLTNMRADLAPLVEQAARTTGYRIYVGEALEPVTPGYVGVYTKEPRREHGPFWTELQRLQEEIEQMDVPGDLPDWA
jgi:hypothetical protein